MSSSHLHDVDYDDLDALWAGIEPGIAAARSLEEAAQLFTDALYERFQQSIVLMRVFATVDAQQLPPGDRAFVERFALNNGVAEPLTDTTAVLSLLATRGIEEAWNDRARSLGHLGLPLLSENFVGSIPMISRLLNEIGFTSAWRGAESGFVTKTLASVNGVFYVPDACTALDERRRLIIPATEFVGRYGVKTVFGVGGSYLSRNTFITMILFCREELSRPQAMKFVPLLGSMKATTTRIVNRGVMFRGEQPPV